MSDGKIENSAKAADRRDSDSDISSLVNANEELVKSTVRKLMLVADVCQCEKCFCDVCAIVLNQIEPRYVTTYKGTLLSQLPQMAAESNVELKVIIARAIKLVAESPQH